VAFVYFGYYLLIAFIQCVAFACLSSKAKNFKGYIEGYLVDCSEGCDSNNNEPAGQCVKIQSGTSYLSKFLVLCTIKRWIGKISRLPVPAQVVLIWSVKTSDTFKWKKVIDFWGFLRKLLILWLNSLWTKLKIEHWRRSTRTLINKERSHYFVLIHFIIFLELSLKDESK